MNSMSRRYQDQCKKDYERDHEREEKEEREKCPTIIKCGCPSSTSIGAVTAGTNVTIASLNLDTTCLCDPRIKLEFASNIIAPAGIGTIDLNFQVFKQCRNQFTPVPVGPAWNYTLANGPFNTTFSFFVCDSDSCDKDCCTYTVVVTVVDPPATGTSISINNATLGAIATCRSNECEKDCRKKCHRRCHCDCD